MPGECTPHHADRPRAEHRFLRTGPRAGSRVHPTRSGVTRARRRAEPGNRSSHPAEWATSACTLSTRRTPRGSSPRMCGRSQPPAMVMTLDGGTSWNPLPALDTQMNGGGAFRAQTLRGPTASTSFGGYPQPQLVAFSPRDPNLMVAAGNDSGVFRERRRGSQLDDRHRPVLAGRVRQAAYPAATVRSLRPPAGWRGSGWRGSQQCRHLRRHARTRRVPHSRGLRSGWQRGRSSRTWWCTAPAEVDAARGSGASRQAGPGRRPDRHEEIRAEARTARQARSVRRSCRWERRPSRSLSLREKPTRPMIHRAARPTRRNPSPKPSPRLRCFACGPLLPNAGERLRQALAARPREGLIRVVEEAFTGSSRSREKARPVRFRRRERESSRREPAFE